MRAARDLAAAFTIACIALVCLWSVARAVTLTGDVGMARLRSPNTGRNTLDGPPQRRLDMSLFGNLPLSGDMRLPLRVEAFNVTNTPNFANPNAALGAPGFGSITSTGNSIPRQMQFAAKLVF